MGGVEQRLASDWFKPCVSRLFLLLLLYNVLVDLLRVGVAVVVAVVVVIVLRQPTCTQRVANVLVDVVSQM